MAENTAISTSVFGDLIPLYARIEWCILGVEGMNLSKRVVENHP